MFRLIFWPVLVPSFLFAVGSGAVLPVLVLAALQLGAGEALASALIAIAGAAALVSTVPVGVFIDRVGDRRAMAIATTAAAVLTALSVVAMAWPSDWSLPLFVLTIILRSPAVTAFSLARQAVVAEALPAHQRGQAMTALGGTMRAGNLVGPLVGAVLLVWLPLWSVFALSVVTAVAATGLLFVRRLNASFDATTTRARQSRTAQELALGVRWGAVTLAGVAITTLAIARVGQPILIALWGTRLGWNESQISLVVAVGAAVEMVLMFPGGYLKDRLGRSLVLVACLVVYGAGFLLAPWWPTSLGFVVAVVIMSIGNGLGAGINMTIGADLSPNVGRAKFLSIWAMFTQGGQLGGPLVISGLLIAATLPAAMLSVGVLAWAGAAWTAAFSRMLGLPGRQRR
jgi:MFS family permease